MALLLVVFTGLSGCQTSNPLYQTLKDVCVAHIGDEAGMKLAIAKASQLGSPEVTSRAYKHVMRGPTVLEARWYSFAGFGDLVVADDGSYCRIGQFQDDPITVLVNTREFEEVETLKNKRLPNGYQNALLRLLPSGAIVDVSEGSHANFLHVMTPGLYLRQRSYDDPALD